MLDWYESIDGPKLEQGDILPKVTALYPVSGDSDSQQGALNTIAVDASVIVLTQSCDLEHMKVDQVLLAQVSSWAAVLKSELERGNQDIKSKKFREKLIQGNVPNLSLLHETSGPPPLEWSVVNFRKLFSLPFDYVSDVATKSGTRLRLMSPYKEHLAQAFARYIMRVGLPHPADDFKAASFDI